MSNSVDNDEQQVWWMDYGATHLMTMHKDWLVDYKKFDKNISLVGCGKESIEAHGKGSVKIISHNDGKLILTQIYGVLYVPDITKNIFGIRKVQEAYPDNGVYESTLHKCKFLIDDVLTFVGSWNKEERLYRMECSIIRQQMNLREASEGKVLELYHRRWGHLDRSYLCKMLKRHLNFDVEQSDEICESCALSKLHKSTIGTMVECKETGEVISAFLYGPMNVKSLRGGKSYCLLLKDQHSNYRYVKMLKDKNESKIIKKIEAVQDDCENSIKKLILDDGLKFTENSKIKNFLRSSGISWKFERSHALVKQENKIIMEMMSSFKRSNTSLPDSLWAEYVETAVQIVNKLGSSSSKKDKSPYEAWLNRMPEIEHLRIIGSKCYICSQVTSEVGVGYLVGYNDKKSSYRIYNPKKKHVEEYPYTLILFDEQIVECESSNDAECETEDFEITSQHKGIINKGFLGDDDDDECA